MSNAAQPESDEASVTSASLALMPDPAQQLRVFKTLSSIIDYAYTFDSEGRFLYSNQALLDLLGLPLNDVIGKTFLELPYPAELAFKLQAQIQQVFDTKQKVMDETSYISPTGVVGYYEYIFNPVFGSDGAVEIVAGSTREVSHRKQNEEIQGRLAAIVDSSEDAIISKDLDGTVVTWNFAASQIFGYASGEIVGESILRLIPQDLLHEEDEISAKMKAGQKIKHYETTRLRKDGRSIAVSLTVSPIRNSNGGIIGSSKIVRDISGRKNMERQLIQSEKIATMGRMAATIAHEINNPLAAVTNLVFLAKGSSADNQQTVEYLTSAEHELARVSHLTRQTLGYYRDTGVHSAVHCHELINEVLRIYQTKIQNREIVVERAFETVPALMASKGELTQVFSNIISNSVDAMPEGGRLRIGVMESSVSQIEICFEDQGIGISDRDLPRVFEPFFTTKGNLGTGIGLWIAKQLVEKHDGQLEISSSTTPGSRGTTIRLLFPVLAKLSSSTDAAQD
jgi:PAS domain S-box-containing protein